VSMCIYKNFNDTVPTTEFEPNPENRYALNG